MNTNAQNPAEGNTSSGMPLHLTPSIRNDDPRIKSPDDFLSKISARKSTLEPRPLPAAQPPVDAAGELTELRQRYDAEMVQWRDYERRIQEWRAQVVSIVQGLKRDAAARQELVAELARCREILRAREEELKRLRAAHPPKLKAVGQ